MASIVFPYVNPDLDGVACAIAVAHWQGIPWEARTMGEFDEETRVVLARLGLPLPQVPPDWRCVDRIWLVDTHHPRQLPPDMLLDRVVRITDHHPGGEPDKFPNARIRNEPVGAAATIVTEMMLEGGAPTPAAIAGLLQAAILSNTLGFQAPASSTRDRQAFDRLAAAAPLPPGLAERMQEARRGILLLGTEDIVCRDVKVYHSSMGPMAVSQLEAPQALELLDRDDLAEALTALAAKHAAAGAILNLVDIPTGTSAIVASGARLSVALARHLALAVDGQGIIRAPRVLQRKTDIVPHLPFLN